MAKKCYIGVSNKARKIKKIYVGVSNKARKVKKGYIGVGGKARLFYTSEPEPSKYGTRSLSSARYYLAAASIGNYGLFSSGYNSQYYTQTTVDPFNGSLTRQSALSGTGVARLAGTNNSAYAIFGGGRNGSYAQQAVIAYNSSLTSSRANDLTYGVEDLAATHFKSGSVDIAMFAGGHYGRESVDCYDTSLTKSKLSLSNPYGSSYSFQWLAGSSNSKYAFFGGGMIDVGSSHYFTNRVNLYNSALTRMTGTDLSVGRSKLDSCTIGDYVLFAGGSTHYNDWSFVNAVDAYNASATRTSPTALSVAKYQVVASSNGQHAFFGGGVTGTSVDKTTDVVEAYNTSLTKTIVTSLTNARHQLAATNIGIYVLFGGGKTGPNNEAVYNTVDVYQTT